MISDNQPGAIPAKYQDFKAPWGPIGEPVFRRSYPRTKENGELESLVECVVRAVDGNLALVPPEKVEPDEREKLLDLILHFGTIPAGRHLYASGVKGRQFLFNCHAAGWDPAEPWAHFTFLFDVLMQGGGGGSNYSDRYLVDMPKLVNRIDLHVTCREDHKDYSSFQKLINPIHDEESEGHLVDGLYFRVPDTREGWVQSAEEVMKIAWAISRAPSDQPIPVEIDVSDVRESGLPLKTSGGIACGPGPLVQMLHDIVKALNACAGRQLTSIDAMIIDHYIAACVVAGGKRRSSRMSVKNWNDFDIFDFINLKRTDGEHWSTNISVEVDDDFFRALEIGDRHAKAVMRAIVQGKLKNGEPGMWNRSRAMLGEREPWKIFCPNPCGEIALFMWENCNLAHVNMEYFVGKNRTELYEAFRLMARWAVRATFGDIPSKRQQEVVAANRRIGVGFFGFHGWLAQNGIKYSECHDNEYVIETLRTAHQEIEAEASAYAHDLDIPVPVKFTTLAPTGTIALLPGVSSSAQAIFNGWFIRRVRYFELDPELAAARAKGYTVKKDRDANNTYFVEYWCEDPLAAKLRARGFDPVEMLEGQFDISFETSLKIQKMLQEHWADNAISFTINLSKENMPTEEQAERLLTEYVPYLKGTTVFPELSRVDMPFEAITKEQFDAWTGPKETVQVEAECVTGCPIR